MGKRLTHIFFLADPLLPAEMKRKGKGTNTLPQICSPTQTKATSSQISNTPSGGSPSHWSRFHGWFDLRASRRTGSQWAAGTFRGISGTAGCLWGRGAGREIPPCSLSLGHPVSEPGKTFGWAEQLASCVASFYLAQQDTRHLLCILAAGHFLYYSRSDFTHRSKCLSL